MAMGEHVPPALHTEMCSTCELPNTQNRSQKGKSPMLLSIQPECTEQGTAEISLFRSQQQLTEQGQLSTSLRLGELKPHAEHSEAMLSAEHQWTDDQA